MPRYLVAFMILPMAARRAHRAAQGFVVLLPVPDCSVTEKVPRCLQGFARCTQNRFMSHRTFALTMPCGWLLNPEGNSSYKIDYITLCTV